MPSARTLSRHRIIDAALDILDSYGLADLTMRRLGKSLSVGPGALYWHFESKQALIAALAERIVAPVCAHTDTPVEQPLNREARCLAVDNAASSLRSALLEHRDGAEIVSAALTHEPLATMLRATLRSATGDDVAANTLLYFVLGATAHEQSALALAQAVAPDATESQVHSVHDAATEQFTQGVALIKVGMVATQAQ